jgi:4-amino-4-deoxy-L-arabinose transferase-like glycosyltransferase
VDRLLLVALAYLFGLVGDYIPRNGDELVYANIARLTAASGHWLPPQSAWDFMRNTKPPLLFQAMVAGGWATTDAAQPASAQHGLPPASR